MIEVRCCCDATKLLGWMEMPMPTAGRYVMFPLRRRVSSWVSVEDVPFDSLRLELVKFRPLASLPGLDYRCFRADETPIETLRLVGVFHENRNP